MKVWIETDEMYPVAYLKTTNDAFGVECEMAPQLFNEYVTAYEVFQNLNNQVLEVLREREKRDG